MGITTLTAQNFKYGKVSKEELLEKFNPADSSANATILYTEEKIKYEYDNDKGFYVLKNIYKRIKIYNKEGLNWANHYVKLFDKSKSLEEEISGLKGITYNFINGEVEGQKLKKDGVFEEELNEYWKKISITLPGVKAGSVIEFKYQVKSPFVSKLDDALLQEVIPIKKIVYQAKIPEYFFFKLHSNIKSELIPNINYLEEREEVAVKWKDKVPGPGGVINKYERVYKYKEKVISVNEENVPRLKDEVYVANLSNYKSKLSFELVSTKSFSSEVNDYSTDWDTIVSKIYESRNFGSQLTKDSYFTEDLDLLLQSLNSNSDKIHAIYNYVKAKVKFNNFIGVNTFNGVKKAYKEGVGNVADINLMLTAMLRYSGIDANPILVSTKTNGIPLFPTRQGFNYVICGVEVDNEVLLLDATEGNTTVDIVPEKVLNWQGRIIREHGSSAWVDLFPKKNSKNTIMVNATLNSDLLFTGKVRSQKTDYFAYDYRNEYVGVVAEDLIKNISKGKGEIEITKLNVKNDKKLENPILQTYDFIYEDGVEEIGSDIYISPMLFLTEEDNIFNKETRNYPIDFSFPRTNKSIISIIIPEGYRVKFIPESVKMVMSDNLGEYSFVIRQNGNVVQVSEVFKINFPIVPVTYYSNLKEVYKTLIEKNSEKIVLEKI